MNNFKVDNSVSELNQVVLWQYDNAYHLLALILYFQSLYTASISRFWDWWIKGVLAIDTCKDFGCAVWGLLLGVRRPLLKDTYNGEEILRPVKVEVYRKILKAVFHLIYGTDSLTDLREYISILFTPDGQDVHCGVNLIDNHDMSISYLPNEYFEDMDRDQQMLFEQNPNVLSKGVLPYPIGIKDNYPVEHWVFGFAGQENLDNRYTPFKMYWPGDIVSVLDMDGESLNWECINQVYAPENTSWDAIKNKFKKSFDGNPFVGGFSASPTGPRVTNYNEKILPMLYSRELLREKTGALPIYQCMWFRPYSKLPTWDNLVKAGIKDGWLRMISNTEITGFVSNVPYYLGDMITVEDKVYMCNSENSIIGEKWEDVKNFFIPCNSATNFYN